MTAREYFVRERIVYVHTETSATLHLLDVQAGSGQTLCGHLPFVKGDPDYSRVCGSCEAALTRRVRLWEVAT